MTKLTVMAVCWTVITPSKPRKGEKEHFAHAYAERLCGHLVAIRAIPFDRELDREQIKQDGLRLEDFHLSQPA
jgi:hypothetical protein